MHEMAPSHTVSKALAVPWLHGPLRKEVEARDASLFQSPLNAHITLHFVLQCTLHGAI